LGDEPVLLVGKHYHKLKDVALSYGFKRAVTIEELHHRWPHMYPDIPPLALDENVASSWNGDGGFKAVLAMTDALVWGRELQLTCDVLRTEKGDVAAVDGPTASSGVSQERQHVQLHNACADFSYAARWPVARFGSGAFRVALERLWLDLIGAELDQTLYGKPHLPQFRFVENLLAELEGGSQVERFYMVGDNPETDIRGARNAGPRWRSVLTRSGLWVGGDNDAGDPADAVVDDALAAVEWILKTEEVLISSASAKELD
jgi:HAD superfamily hydrolase (TIGR01456 family)